MAANYSPYHQAECPLCGAFSLLSCPKCHRQHFCRSSDPSKGFYGCVTTGCSNQAGRMYAVECDDCVAPVSRKRARSPPSPPPSTPPPTPAVADCLGCRVMDPSACPTHGVYTNPAEEEEEEEKMPAPTPAKEARLYSAAEVMALVVAAAEDISAWTTGAYTAGDPWYTEADIGHHMKKVPHLMHIHIASAVGERATTNPATRSTTPAPPNSPTQSVMNVPETPPPLPPSIVYDECYQGREPEPESPLLSVPSTPPPPPPLFESLPPPSPLRPLSSVFDYCY
jgi:hypothetical protein